MSEVPTSFSSHNYLSGREGTPISATVEELWEKLESIRPDAVRFAEGLIRGGDLPIDADDVIQVAYLCAWRALPRFQGDRLRPWIFKIVRNRVVSMTRGELSNGRGALRQVSIETGGDDDGNPLDIRDPKPDGSPEYQMLSKEMEALRLGLIKNLEPDFRSVVLLCDCEGYSYEEAAEQLGVPVGTVKSRLNRARKQLQLDLAAREGYSYIDPDRPGSRPAHEGRTKEGGRRPQFNWKQASDRLPGGRAGLSVYDWLLERWEDTGQRAEAVEAIHRAYPSMPRKRIKSHMSNRKSRERTRARGD